MLMRRCGAISLLGRLIKPREHVVQIASRFNSAANIIVVGRPVINSAPPLRAHQGFARKQ
jgi:orotidine-5'-phosphate decarboxylase